MDGEGDRQPPPEAQQMQRVQQQHLVKSRHKHDVRVFKLGPSPKFQEILDAVKKAYGLAQVERITYKDNEGDDVTLSCDEDLELALLRLCGSSLHIAVLEPQAGVGTGAATAGSEPLGKGRRSGSEGFEGWDEMRVVFLKELEKLQQREKEQRQREQQQEKEQRQQERDEMRQQHVQLLEPIRAEVAQQGQLLRAILQKDAGVLGSSSYIEVFSKSNCELQRLEQLMPQPSASRAWASDEAVKERFEDLFREAAEIDGGENDAYLPACKRILDVMARALENKDMDRPDGLWKRLPACSRVIIDTHKTPGYLERLAPDISVCSRYTGAAAVHAFNVVSLVELQRRKLDQTHRGKALVYIEKLMKANPRRTHAMCLLTDLNSFEVYKASRGSDLGLKFYRCPAVELTAGWEFLLEFMCMTDEQAGWQGLNVTLDSGCFRATGHAASTTSVDVYSGIWTSTNANFAAATSDLQVCKVYKPGCSAARDAVTREVNALRKIAESVTPPAMFPALLAWSTEQGLVITNGLGRTPAHITESMVDQLLQGLKHLHHTVRLVHNDIEPRHILCSSSKSEQVLLIDYDLCRAVAAPPEDGLLYAGTLIYAADDVLDGIAKGNAVRPQTHHDLVSLVKSIYVMRNPRMESEVARVVEEVRVLKEEGGPSMASRVQEFWKAFPRGIGWRKAITLAARPAPDADAYTTLAEAVKALFE